MSAAAKAFAAAVTKSSKNSARSSSQEMASALAGLVKARLRKRSEPKPQTYGRAPLGGGGISLGFDMAGAERSRRRRSRRVRSGRLMRWRNTDKIDVSRIGTFRHYLISTVRKYDNSYDALAAHADSEYASKKLDIGWVAAEGFIEFI